MSSFNFGKNLRAVRQPKNISQAAMALMLNISQTTYSRIERKPFAQNKDQVYEIARVLNVRPSILLPHAVSAVLVRKTKEILNDPFGATLIVTIECVFLHTAYELTQDICILFKAFSFTSIYAPWLVALATGLYTWYAVKRIKKERYNLMNDSNYFTSS